MRIYFCGMVLCVVLMVSGGRVAAQLVDNTATFKTIPADTYFRLFYDNDYFTKTDYYYTQGVAFEYASPGLAKFPLSKLLLRPAGSSMRYGITADVVDYTPTSITSPVILYGDRPFAGTISFKTFAEANDSAKQQRISSGLTLGIIGPAAQGEEIQTGIHKAINNVLPQGWQYQIRNDVILNYEVNYEKRLWQPGNALLVNSTAGIKLGTLNDKLDGGFNFMTGHFNDPYLPASRRHKKVQYYFYGQSRLNIIGYDATLQGGVFDRKSPYTIDAADISRFTFQADAGLVLQVKWLYLCYSQSVLTNEFRTGLYHRWGGVSAGFSF